MVRRVQPHKTYQREAGIAYVMILLLLATLTSLSLAFLHKTGTQIAATANRGESMQAHYLAESAANHAMWRLLNDPSFAPAPDIYYMHSFANGRYGYKVRKPTATTFATVATVGAIGDIVTQQSYVQYVIPSNVFTVYGSSTNMLPIYRRLIGANWTDPGDVLIGGASTSYWVELEGCPIRKELIGGIIDGADEMKVAVYDGTAWGNDLPLGHGDRNYKCFDIAYESQSGHALVVGRDLTDTPLKYNIWDGTSWVFATTQDAFSLPGGNVHDVVMASQPGGNEILIAVVSSWDEIRLVQWDGSSFNDLGTIEGTVARNDFRIVEIIYEHQSGDAMVVWSRNSDSALKYLMWDGATLGPEGSLPDFLGNENYVIRGAADSNPTSDYIVVAAIDNFYDISVAIWDGDAWIDFREIETAAATHLVQSFDVAWEAAGDDVVIAWGPWNLSNVRFLTWKKGTLLADSTVQQGPDFQFPWVVRLLPISGTEKIILLSENSSPSQLRYSLWTGDQFKGDPAVLLEPDVPVQNDVAFDIAEANVPRTGGTGTGGGGNLAPVVDAGPNETIYLPINQVDLDGTVTDDGLPNPPATVDTTWIKVSGPGTVTFDDPSLVDTVARFSDAGEYVLKLTADDSDLSAFDELTITVEGGSKLLFVVPDASSLTGQDTDRKVLMEGWGWTVAPISASATQTEFDVACASSQVAYVSEQINPDDLGTKLRQAVIGVVNEQGYLVDEFGFSGNREWPTPTTTLDLTDNTHYITFPFVVGDLVIASAATEVISMGGTKAPGLQVLGMFPQVGQPGLGTIETGGGLYGGGTAMNRRVQLPWGRIGFDINSLTDAGRAIMRRAIEWAAGADLCDADFTPNTKIGGFSTTAYGSGTLEGVAYLPEGKSFNLTAVPAGGALISVDIADMFYLTDLSGNFLTSLPMPGGSPTGVTLVQSGAWADHLAVSDKQNDGIKFFDLSGNLIGSFSTNVSADFDSTTPEDVVFIGTTASGTYDNHLAIPDLGRDKVYLVGQNGGWVSSIDISTIMFNVKGAAHLPGTDKLLLVDFSGQAFIVDFAGNLLNQYDTGSFGTSSPKAITINPLTCDHLVGDDTSDLIVTLNLLGGSGDTDPPSPDPMTWASPPTAVDQSSITMTATTASDPSGVEYSFECTGGGGNHSGWQVGTTYVDSGLSPETQYTYRVKARDRSSNQNETGWSAEASATTLSNDMYVNDITMGYRQGGVNYYGQATVWIKAVGGMDISGAVVYGDWSGSVSGASIGNTGSDGKVMLESPAKKNGGTFTFTVSAVSKIGYTYNPSLNVETSDTIEAP